MSAHTPEPWRVGNLTLNEGQTPILSDDKRVAAIDCHTEFKRGKGRQAECPERDANARLIAAAPDLLRCLQNMVHALNAARAGADWLEQKIEATNTAALAAITKATGQ